MFSLNVVNGCMPSDLGAGTSAEIEEEWRLLYVAMIRAKDDLHLSLSRLTDHRKSGTKSHCGPDFRDKKLQRASLSQWVRSLERGRAQ